MHLNPLKYQAKWVGSNWHPSFVILYADSTLIWYESQTSARAEGSLMLKHSPELIAVGQFALRMFKVPPTPNGGRLENVIVIGERHKQRVHYFMANSSTDLE